MKVFVGIIKVIGIVIILSMIQLAGENLSEKNVVNKHIQVGEVVEGGQLRLMVQNVKVEGQQVSIDVAVTATEKYDETIYKDENVVEFYTLDEGEKTYESESLVAVLDESGDIFIPRGKTKTLTYLVNIPRNTPKIGMEYDSYSGRTYYENLFDIPIE